VKAALDRLTVWCGENPDRALVLMVAVLALAVSVALNAVKMAQLHQLRDQERMLKQEIKRLIGE
jgi:hypothetical protein